MKLKKKKYVGLYGCMGMLGALTLAMVFPVDVKEVQAADSDQAKTRAMLAIGSSISVSLAKEVPFKITPSSSGTFDAGSTNVTVSTSATNGYDVFVNSTTGAANSNRLVKSGDATKYVSPISGTGAVTPATMVKNTWGYTLASGANQDVKASTAQYKAVPLVQGASPEKTGSSTTVGSALRSDAYTLGFGAKVDTTVAQGEYVADVTVSVIAKPEPFSDIRQITYMQEMTTDICKRTATPTGAGSTSALTAPPHRSPTPR